MAISETIVLPQFQLHGLAIFDVYLTISYVLPNLCHYHTIRANWISANAAHTVMMQTLPFNYYKFGLYNSTIYYI